MRHLFGVEPDDYEKFAEKLILKYPVRLPSDFPDFPLKSMLEISSDVSGIQTIDIDPETV